VAVIPSERFINIIETPEPMTDLDKWNIMMLTHDHPMAGHPGRDKTIHKTKQIMTWPNMNTWIANLVKGCATCQQNKILTHRKKTPPYMITTKEEVKPFEQIAMDLITGLPL
jgi:hypothetical protein